MSTSAPYLIKRNSDMGNDTALLCPLYSSLMKVWVKRVRMTISRTIPCSRAERWHRKLRGTEPSGPKTRSVATHGSAGCCDVNLNDNIYIPHFHITTHSNTHTDTDVALIQLHVRSFFFLFVYDCILVDSECECMRIFL